MTSIEKKITQLQCNLILASVIGLTSILKYIIDAKQLYISYPSIVKFYSLLFFLIYSGSIFIAIAYIQWRGNRFSKYGELWFVGFKFIVLNCLIQIFIALIMEFIFPQIRITFLEDQEMLLQKEIFNKEIIATNMIAIKKYYYLLKTAYFTFAMLVLGTVLNTIIGIAIQVYQKQMIKK